MITLPVLPNATGASWSGWWRGMVNCEVGCKMVVRWVLLAIEPCMCHRQCPRNAPPSRVSSPALMPSHAGAITSNKLLTPGRLTDETALDDYHHYYYDSL